MTATPEGTVRVAREGGRGWHFIAREKFDANPAAFVVADADGEPVRADPLDHDADGRKGGSVSGGADLAALRAKYVEKVGKKPFAGWKADELRRRINEAGA